MQVTPLKSVATRRLLFGALSLSLGLLVTPGAARAQAAAEPASGLSKYVLPEHCDTFLGKKNRIYLHGPWRFKQVAGEKGYDQTDEGTTQGYWKAGYDDSAWKQMNVPLQIRYGPKSWDHVNKPGIAYLRHSVRIPADARGHRAILRFRRVAFEPVLWVNGREVARPTNLSPKKVSDVHHIDVTDAVRWGADNQITVRVYVPKMRRYYYRQVPSGIRGPCWIELRPPVYCKEMLITPKLPDRIEVRCLVMNSSSKSRQVSLRALAEPWQGKPDYHARLTGRSTSTSLEIGSKTLRPGENPVRFSMRLQKPVLWDTFNPFLYSLKLLNGSTRIGWERFGLREFTVRDQYFYLNGHKVFIAGTVPEMNLLRHLMEHVWDFRYNRNEYLRRFLAVLRENNVNAIIRIEQIPPPIFLDICDELGLLQIPTPDVLMESEFSTYGKELLVNDFEKYLDMALRRNVVDGYNHPSLVAYTSEGECNRAPGVATQMHLYRRILNKYDSSRLFSSAQSNVMNGRVPRKPWYPPYPYDTEWVPLIPPPPWDFMNPAALSGSGTDGFVHTLIPEFVRRHQREWSRFFFGEPKPTIFTEALYYYGFRSHNQYWQHTLQKYGPVLKDGKLDTKLYCDLYGVGIPPDQRHMNYHPKDIKVVGIRNALDKRKLFPRLARHVGEMIEMVRMNDDVIQGFGAISGPLVTLPKSYWRLDPATIAETDFSRTMKKACAPVFVCADLHSSHNLFAGREYAVKVFCFNYFARDLPDARLEVSLMNEQGRTLVNGRQSLGVLADGERRDLLHHLRIPERLPTGNYRLGLRLHAAGRLQSENEYGLFVLSRADVAAGIATGKRVAVVNSGHNIIYGFGPSRVLARLGVKVDYIKKDYSKLGNFDVVVIAPGQASRIDGRDKDALLQYLRGGGRVVCLEQTGKIPWLSGLSLEGTGTSRWMQRYFGGTGAIGIGGDLIEPDHPVFAGIARFENWRQWTRTYGRVYKRPAFPLSEGVILAGGTNNEHKPKTPGIRFGMLIAELKVGKGVVLLSQVEAMDLYGYDSVATKYLHNLFAYAVGDRWDGRYAAPLRVAKAKK